MRFFAPTIARSDCLVAALAAGCGGSPDADSGAAGTTSGGTAGGAAVGGTAAGGAAGGGAAAGGSSGSGAGGNAGSAGSGNAPALLTPIPNQTGVEGAPFLLDVSGNFSAQTSYSSTGIPPASGLAFYASTGVLSGTPHGAAVANSPESKPNKASARNAHGA